MLVEVLIWVTEDMPYVGGGCGVLAGPWVVVVVVEGVEGGWGLGVVRLVVCAILSGGDWLTAGSGGCCLLFFVRALVDVMLFPEMGVYGR